MLQCIQPRGRYLNRMDWWISISTHSSSQTVNCGWTEWNTYICYYIQCCMMHYSTSKGGTDMITKGERLNPLTLPFAPATGALVPLVHDKITSPLWMELFNLFFSETLCKFPPKKQWNNVIQLSDMWSSVASLQASCSAQLVLLRKPAHSELIINHCPVSQNRAIFSFPTICHHFSEMYTQLHVTTNEGLLFDCLNLCDYNDPG